MEYVRLGDVCLLKAGKFISAKDISDTAEENSYPCYGGNGLRGYVKNYTHEGTFPLIGRQGALCGNVNYANGKFYATEHAVVVKPLLSMDTRWLYYMLSGLQLGKLATGAAQPGLAVSTLNEIAISIPCLEEQHKIAATLDKISELVDQRRQQMETLDTLVKAQFIEMFGDPSRNNFGWEKKKLVDVCTKLTDGTHFSPESFQEGDYKYITAKNIKQDGFDFSNLTYVTKAVHDSIYTRCNPEFGDVLYIKDGVTTGIAMVNSLTEPFTMLSSVALLKQNRALILGEFLCSVLNNEEMYKNIRSNMGGAAITRLTIKKLNEIQIILPPMELQQEFVSIKQQVDKSKHTIQKSLETLETLKKSLMQQYFG